MYLGIPAILSTPDAADLHNRLGTSTSKPISCGTQVWEQALAMVIVFVAVLLEWLAVLVCAVFWLFAVFMAYIYLPCAGIWALYRWLADR